MTVRVDKKSRWYEPALQPNEGPSRDFDQFAPIDTRGSASQLRSFLEKETQVRAASGTATSMTLVPGKLYLRQQPSGLWELTHSRGRGFFDCYVGETAEELIELARSMNLLSSED